MVDKDYLARYIADTIRKEIELKAPPETVTRSVVFRKRRPTQPKPDLATIKAAFYTYDPEKNEGAYFVGGDRVKPIKVDTTMVGSEASVLLTNLGKDWRLDFLGLVPGAASAYTDALIFTCINSKGIVTNKPLAELTQYFDRDSYLKLLGSGFSTFLIDVGDGLTFVIGYWFLDRSGTQIYREIRNTTEYLLPDQTFVTRSPRLNLAPVLVNDKATRTLLLDQGTRTSPVTRDVFRVFDGSTLSPRLANTPLELLDRSYRPTYNVYHVIPRGQVTSWIGDNIYFVQRPRSGPIARWFSNPSTPVLVNKKERLTIKGYKVGSDRFAPLPDKTVVMQPLGDTPVTINSLSFHP